MVDENFVNGLAILATGFSTILLSILSYRIIHREGKKRYYEVSMVFTFVFASVASLFLTLFRIPYLLSVSMGQSWVLASFFYYFFMSLALSCLLATGIGLKAPSKFKLSFTSLLGAGCIIIAYGIGLFGEPLITAPNNESNTLMTVLGVLLVFGSITILLLLSAITFLGLYRETGSKSIRSVLFGIIIISTAALSGGISDAVGGDIGRLIDPISYVILLGGLFLIYRGFKGN